MREGANEQAASMFEQSQAMAAQAEVIQQQYIEDAMAFLQEMFGV